MNPFKQTTGFDTPEELRSFNSAWAHLGVTPDETWPMPRWKLEIHEHDEVLWTVKNQNDAEALKHAWGYSPLEAPGIAAWVNAEILAPLQLLNTSIHEALHFEMGLCLNLTPHSLLVGQIFHCFVEIKNDRREIVTIKPYPAGVGYDLETYRGLSQGNPMELAAVLYAPNLFMSELMPDGTEQENFENDFYMANELGLTKEEEDAAVEIAVETFSGPSFIERVKTAARRFRPLIQGGGQNLLTGGSL
jgi:hypothetical protein